MKLFWKVKTDNFADLKKEGLSSYRWGQLDNAVDKLSQALDIHPDDPEAVYMRGMAYARMGDLSSAIRDFESMYAMPTPSLLNKRDACYNLGKAYAELEKWDDAINWYDRVTELDPGFVNVYANRGAAHLRLGDSRADLHEFELAVADLNMAITLQPDDALAYFNRAIANVRLQNEDQSKEDLQKFLEFAPEDHPYRKEVKKILAEADKPSSTKLDMIRERKQKELYQRIIKANDGNQFAEAVELCDQFLEEWTSVADVWNEKAVALWCMDRTEEALAVIQEGINHNPGDTFLYFTRGDLLAALGHYRESIGAYEKFLATGSPDDEKYSRAEEKIRLIKGKITS